MPFFLVSLLVGVLVVWGIACLVICLPFLVFGGKVYEFFVKLLLATGVMGTIIFFCVFAFFPTPGMNRMVERWAEKNDAREVVEEQKAQVEYEKERVWKEKIAEKKSAEEKDRRVEKAIEEAEALKKKFPSFLLARQERYEAKHRAKYGSDWKRKFVLEQLSLITGCDHSFPPPCDDCMAGRKSNYAIQNPER